MKTKPSCTRCGKRPAVWEHVSWTEFLCWKCGDHIQWLFEVTGWVFEEIYTKMEDK